MRVRGQGRQKWIMLLGVFVVIFVFSFLVTKYKDGTTVDAADLGAFDAGNIMSDYQMGNYNAMNEGEIWDFLKQKGNCNDTRTYLADRYTSYSYHIKDGHFVCLADETFGDGTAYGDAAPHGESAAHIIWQAAQDYRINPQALIVLLQKEQGLITDSWPNNRQYRSATGYGCPDTAACDSQYYGFKNQVRKAAAMFRTVLDGGWTNYPLGWNYVQYNPNSDCGGDWVNIRSLATSALYRYTPYQPNGAALSAGYGTGDSCSAYGNRNFYLYFEDWFGGITRERRAVDPARPGDRYYDISSDDIYTITSEIDNSYAVDIYGGASRMVNGTNIQLYGSHNSENQQFKFVYNDNGFYEIINPATGKSLNVYGGFVDAETNVQLWDRDGSCAGYWRLDRNSDGTYFIQSACSDLVLDVYSGIAENERNIQVYYRHGGDNQKWVIRKTSKRFEINESVNYTITSEIDNSYAVDIYGGASRMVNGTNIQLYGSHNSENQQFKFVYNDNGFYEIINPATGKSLNVYGGFVDAETNVQLWDRDGSCAGYWRLDRNSDGTYFIQSACSDLVLDVYSGIAENERNIQVYYRHGGDNQKWVIRKTS